MPKLLLIAEGTTEEFEFASDLTIGRGDTNMVRLAGPEISRNHAAIQHRDQVTTLRDLESKNGVFLNGFKITSATLKPGDEIQIGKFILVFSPPDGINLAGLIARQRSIENSNQPPVSEARETSSFSAEALEKLLRGAPQIFYDMKDIAALAESPEVQGSNDFVFESIRLHKELVQFQRSHGPDPVLHFLKVLLQGALAALRADRGVIAFRDGEYNVETGAVFPEDAEVTLNAAVLNTTLADGKAVLCNNAYEDNRFLKAKSSDREHIGSLLAVPIVKSGKPEGVIYVDVLEHGNAFRPGHLHMLNMIGCVVSGCMSWIRPGKPVSQNRQLAASHEAKAAEAEITVRSIETDDSEKPEMVTWRAKKRDGDSASSQQIDLKREYLIAREEWIRSGRKGPAPAPPRVKS